MDGRARERVGVFDRMGALCQHWNHVPSGAGETWPDCMFSQEPRRSGGYACNHDLTEARGGYPASLKGRY